MKSLSKISVLILAVFGVLSIRTSGATATFPKKPIPMIQWVYSYKDGSKANTIGAALNGNAMPITVPYPTAAYGPTDISNAYGFNLIPTNANGTGQTIALIEGGNSTTILSDFTNFCNAYGLPYNTNNLSNTISIHYANTNLTSNDPAWAGEMALDVEWAHALAPGAKLVVVVGSIEKGTNYGATNTNGLDPIKYAVTNLGATVVSMSYGSWGTNGGEPAPTEDADYQNSPGVTFVASAGDSGAGTAANQSITALTQPAASPYVLCVGGTSLYYNSTNKQVTQEVVWNNWNAGLQNSGTGGGVSEYEDIPPYQVGWNVTTGRGAPDVSFVADPYTGVNVYEAGGWIKVGGTSLSAPCWAGLIACRKTVLPSTEYALFNTVLYQTSRTRYASLFRDILFGNNNTTSNNGFVAGVGYDLVTGLGSPIAPAIVSIPLATNNLTNNGVVAWGRNDAGQSIVPSSLSNSPASGSALSALSGGILHSLAIKTNGTVIAWGANTSGQCTVPSALTNPAITATNPAIQVSAGYAHSIALCSNGMVYAWGDNTYNQTNIPVSATNVAQIAAGAYHSVAIKSDGSVVAWGNNTYGQTNVPLGLTNANSITNHAVAAGYAHSMVIRENGTITVWGNNSYGQTNIPSVLISTNYTSSNPVVGVSAGYGHCAALTSNGQVIAWGENNYGQTTIPTILGTNIPVTPNAPTNSQTPISSQIVQISTGAYHTMALRRNGTVVAWGCNASGQCNIPSSLNNILQIAAGAYHSLVTH